MIKIETILRLEAIVHVNSRWLEVLHRFSLVFSQFNDRLLLGY
jgi:hypothetical protein